MTEIIIIGIIVAVVLGVLLGNQRVENRKLNAEIKEQRAANLELLKHIPVKEDGISGVEPLTVERMADALRFEGFFPEVEGNWVHFKVQGEGYHIDANRLPLLFLVKSYVVDPKEWEMDLLREAAHKMSDELVMVKATISDDGKSLHFFIAARDRNYESFRGNLTAYLRILEDGQGVMNEAYHKMVEEKREAALKACPVIPSVEQEKKVLS